MEKELAGSVAGRSLTVGEPDRVLPRDTCDWTCACAVQLSTHGMMLLTSGQVTIKAAPRRTAHSHASSTRGPKDRPTPPARHSDAPTSIPTDPKRSLQSLIAPRRESPSRAKQRRVAPARATVARRAGGASVEGYLRTHSPRHGRHSYLPFAQGHGSP